MASSLLVLIRGRIGRTDSGLRPKPQHGFLSQSALGIAQEGEKKEASSTSSCTTLLQQAPTGQVK